MHRVGRKGASGRGGQPSPPPASTPSSAEDAERTPSSTALNFSSASRSVASAVPGGAPPPATTAPRNAASDSRRDVGLWWCAVLSHAAYRLAASASPPSPPAFWYCDTRNDPHLKDVFTDEAGARRFCPTLFDLFAKGAEAPDLPPRLGGPPRGIVRWGD